MVSDKYRRTAERLVCPLAGCDGITLDFDCLEWYLWGQCWNNEFG